jgi:drug/metabolite transporter (DMT)-like permease
MINKNTSSMAIGAIIIGFSPILAKAVNLTPTTIGFYRFIFGALGMTFYLFIKRNHLDLSSLKSALPYMILSGLLFALDLWFWHRSIIYIGAGIATLLANTQVFYLVLFGWFFYKEKPKWYFYPGMLLAIIGLTLSTLPHLNFSMMDKSSLGVIFGLLTGLSYALVTFTMQKSTKIYQGKGPLPIFIITIFAAVFSLLFVLNEGNIEIPKGPDLYFMILYGAGVHFLGWLCITFAITNIPLALASLLLLLQPVFATFFGNLIYNEPLSQIQIFGLTLSLIGIFLASNAKK